MYDIITVGSATVDVFVKTKNPVIRSHANHKDVCYAIGQKVLVNDLHIDTGGGGINTASAFTKFGLKTGWLGKCGTDLNAEIISKELARKKISVVCSKPAPGNTGYSVILTGLNNNRTILAYKGVNDLLGTKDVPWNKLRTKWFYFSSMLGKSLQTLKAIAQYSKKNNIPYAFNASMYLAKQGIKKLKPIINGCDLLILNKEEARAMTGKKKTCPDQLKTLQKHAKTVVITDGAKKSHGYDGKHCCEITPPKVKVAEPTGAGDAFASGMLTGLLLKNDVCYGMQLGTVQAVSVIQELGAKKGQLTLKEANKLINKYKLSHKHEAT